jgi:hypothetical protein
MEKINIVNAGLEHLVYIPEIEEAIINASKVKGTGLAKRTKEYLTQKIIEGKAVIGLTKSGKFAGFCYIECWGHKKFVANSGLIVIDEYRGMGLAMKIKQKAFKLSRKLFPDAKIFGLTTSLAVMKINSALGYKPVTFSELTDDEEFWKGCQTCSYYDVLFRTNRMYCLCTGMLFDPVKDEKRWIINKSLKKNGKKIKKTGKELIALISKSRRKQTHNYA